MAMTIARNKLALLLLCAFVLFYVMGVLYFPRSLFLELMRAMLGATALLVSIVYSLDIPSRFRAGQQGVVLIRVGIVLSWTAVWVQSFTRIYYFELRPGPIGPVLDAFAGLPSFVAILAASLHLVAIGLDQHGLVRLRRNLLLVAWSLLFGAVLILGIKLGRVIMS